MTSKVDELKRKFDELARLDDDRRRLSDWPSARTTSPRVPTRPPRLVTARDLESLADEQERLRRELDELLKNSPSLRAEALAAQPSEADALAARARGWPNSSANKPAAPPTTAPASRRSRPWPPSSAPWKTTPAASPFASTSRWRKTVAVVWMSTPWPAPAMRSSAATSIKPATARSEAENALNRLTRDVEDVRNDPKALARRLAQRQEALKNETAEAVREAREHPPQTPEGKAALADRLKPLFDAPGGHRPPGRGDPRSCRTKRRGPRRGRKTARARDDLREPRPRDVEGHQNEARDALNRLADALPDANQRRDRARQKLGEARSRYEEIARDLEKHLRETAPKPGQPHDPGRAPRTWPSAIAPLARRAARGRRGLERDRPRAAEHSPARPRGPARHRARRCSRNPPPAGLRPARTRDQARRATAAGGLARSRCVPDRRHRPPFAIDKPVDLSAKYNDLKGQTAAWRPSAPVDAQGTIDLGQIYWPRRQAGRVRLFRDPQPGRPLGSHADRVG